MKIGFCGNCGEAPPPHAVICPRCGRELVSAVDDPLVGTEIGSYRVTARLGVGGMGSVYAGVEKNIDKKVAIKVVHPHLQGLAELPTLLAEAKAVNAIGDRAIVDVHGFGALPDGRQYLVMEQLEGESLDVIILRQRKLGLAEIVSLGDGILSGLEAAHAAGFVHRDIKPANVFVVRPKSGDPYVKLLDFGLAQRSRVKSVMALGTPGYVAPEQTLAGASVGPAADLYAVGCVLFECATGHLPFDRPNAGEVLELHRLADRPRVKKERPELPAALDALVASMMSIDIAGRPATAAEARRALKALAPKRRSRAWLVAAAALLVAAGASGWVLLRPAPTSITVAGDPLAEATARTAGDVRQALKQQSWQEAFERLSTAERSFPQRKEWTALRAEARAALWLAATEALGRDEVAAAAQLAALNPPPKEDPLAKELARAAFAQKNGMVRVAGGWVDAYEYPNRAGAAPTAKVDFKDAVKLCNEAGKHLCSEDEWQRACSGGAARAFPWGDKPGPERCHHKGRLKDALPAGALGGCVTPEGVHDLSGNVAEWTDTALREGAPQRVIRGGSFGQSDAKLGCTARDYYLPGLGGAKHIGLRCCL